MSHIREKNQLTMRSCGTLRRDADRAPQLERYVLEVKSGTKKKRHSRSIVLVETR